jgi:glycosyltransferase involved in cell wall biosynthesis
MLSHLPSPIHGKTGWPWDIESDPLPPVQQNGTPWPRISIITPSYNQGQYIEETIRSIILQNYPNLEYLIIDGKSTDGTIEIIKKYHNWIDYWISESDNSQSHAINKGFNKCTGEIVNWVCSDDMLSQNALNKSVKALVDNINCLFIGKGIRIDRNGKIIDEIKPSEIKCIVDLLDISNFWRKSGSIMQQSCLYPLSIVKDSGLLNEKNHYTMDYELWGKILTKNIKVARIDVNIGVFRWYGGQKTSNFNKVTNSLVRTAINLILDNKEFRLSTKIRLISGVIKYHIKYYYHTLRSWMGLKRRLKILIHG